MGRTEIGRIIRQKATLKSLVVKPAGKNSDFFGQDLINQSMLLVNTPRPAAGELTFQRLRLTAARKGIPLHIPDKANNP